MSHNLSSAAVVIGAFRVKPQTKQKCSVKKSVVRITDRLDMTIAVDLDVKTTKQSKMQYQLNVCIL